MMKRTKVLLVCPCHPDGRFFDIVHAENLLKMRNNGGWTLPPNSKFKFDRKNGIEFRRYKKRDLRTTEEGFDRQGDSAPEQD